MHILKIPESRSLEIKTGIGVTLWKSNGGYSGPVGIEASENAYPLRIYLRGSVVSVKRFDGVVGMDRKGLVPEARVDFLLLNPDEFHVASGRRVVPPFASGDPKVIVTPQPERAKEAMDPFNRALCETCFVEIEHGQKYCIKHEPPKEETCGRPLPPAGGTARICDKARSKVGGRTMPYCADCLADLSPQAPEAPEKRRRGRPKKTAE